MYAQMQMKDVNRNLTYWALENPLFPNHMSFILGPRQTGKTTLAKNFIGNKVENYFNWDNRKIKNLYRNNPYFFETLQKPNEKIQLVFDEIHKMRKWKDYLKGAFDTYQQEFGFIITGSGRLDLFQKGGDSLAGRYDPYFLYPLTPGEIDGKFPKKLITTQAILSATPISESTLEHWEKTSGFPEPFFTGSEEKTKKWWEQYKIRVTEEDLRDLTKLESVDLMRDLLHLLPERISSPLSLNSLREDLQCSHSTVKRYIRSLSQLFFTFEVPPYYKRIHRAIKKEKKYYYFHHSAVRDPGAKFENMVALLLSKWCSSAREQALGNYELYFLRDQDRREVDFLITLEHTPHILIEAKLSDTQFGSSLTYYGEKLKIPMIQIVRTPDITIKRQGNAVCSIHQLASICG